jgi:hypothetical protein
MGLFLLTIYEWVVSRQLLKQATELTTTVKWGIETQQEKFAS